MGIGIKHAFDRHSDIEVRHVARVRKVYDYPTDAEWEQRHDLIAWADLIHVMEIPSDFGKPTLLHHHGTYYRRAPSLPSGIASTLDLELLGAGPWLPAPYDIDSLIKFREPSDVLTIAHAGTWAEGKSTGPFLSACERLSREAPIRVIHITGQPWIECLRLKGTADIYFDQVLTGYGNNAVEAWGMGIPVIAGIEPAEARRQGHLIPDQTPDEMERRFGGLPFVRADEGSIYDALRLLLDSRERKQWGERGLAHVRRFHEQRGVVRQLEDIYRRAVS